MGTGNGQDRQAKDSTELLKRLGAASGSEVTPPRVLVVLAHSDDEVLALGGRLERLQLSRLITVTDGAPTNGADAAHHGFPSLEAYRAARRAELTAALRDAGLPATVVAPFAAATPDQEACFHLSTLARAIAQEMQVFEPGIVLTHPYEGGHPDHDACAFAVHGALALLRAQEYANDGWPVIVEAPSYHADGQGGMATGRFLPGSKSPAEDAMVICPLSPTEQRNKQRRLAFFVSQVETLAQFGVGEERYRLAPCYDFSQPPHSGQLFYERFPWGMTGERFCKLAAAAQRELFGGSEAIASAKLDRPTPAV